MMRTWFSETQCKPIVIRNVRYPSHAAAARALGITRSAVTRHALNGTLDKAGLGRFPDKKGSFNDQPKKTV